MKESTKAGIKNVIMGELKDNKSLKLSDFIDEKFLDDLDGEPETTQKLNELKTPLSRFIQIFEKDS